MSEQTTYIPNRQEDQEFGERLWEESEIQQVLESGMFILAEPDIRLQAIADLTGHLYCALHQMWLDPPDATHRDHPELDPVNSGEDCGNAVDVGRAVRFALDSLAKRKLAEAYFFLSGTGWGGEQP